MPQQKRSDIMSAYYGITSSGVSTLFSSLSTSSTTMKNSFDSMYGLTSSTLDTSYLGTYASIRNGSYATLVKAYYEKNEDANVTTTSTSTDTVKELKLVESSAEDLKSVADELYSSGSTLFATDDDGEYDTDAIYEKVSEFVDSYNSLISDSKNINSSTIASAVSNLQNATENYEVLLKKAGITINSDGKLSIDEDTFKQANMSTVKTIFSGTNSLAYQTSAYAATVDYYSAYEATKSNTYTSSGAYSYNYASTYTSYI